MKQDTDMFVSLQKIKDKYSRNFEYKKVISRSAQTPTEMEEKIRMLTVMLEMSMGQNKELIKWQQTYETILQEKNSQIDLKQKQLKKYQSQLLEAMGKNEDLVNYSRKLANQYSTLLNSIQDKVETENYKQMATEGKLNAVQEQLAYLRNDMLNKMKIESPQRKQKAKGSRKNYKSYKKENSLKSVKTTVPNSHQKSKKFLQIKN